MDSHCIASLIACDHSLSRSSDAEIRGNGFVGVGLRRSELRLHEAFDLRNYAIKRPIGCFSTTEGTRSQRNSRAGSRLPASDPDKSGSILGAENLRAIIFISDL